MAVKIDPSWYAVLQQQFEAPYFGQLKEFLVEERRQYTCYPPGSLIFSAFDHTPFDKVKVVILGQDPYHEAGQAMGLCFSVPDGIAVPPSLVNIIKEINDDLGVNIPTTCGDLSGWAEQGVLLPTMPAATSATAGRPSPTPPYGRCRSAAAAWCSCCGAATPSPSAASSTPRGTMCSRRRIRRRCRHTGASSAAVISRRPMRCSPHRDRHPYGGRRSGERT